MRILKQYQDIYIILHLKKMGGPSRPPRSLVSKLARGFAVCAPQASVYGKCLAKNLDEIKKIIWIQTRRHASHASLKSRTNTPTRPPNTTRIPVMVCGCMRLLSPTWHYHLVNRSVLIFLCREKDMCSNEFKQLSKCVRSSIKGSR
ncbi:hypothetical protein AAMO2058_000801000 [Amorphochlora amoebiformis]